MLFANPALLAAAYRNAVLNYFTEPEVTNSADFSGEFSGEFSGDSSGEGSPMSYRYSPVQYRILVDALIDNGLDLSSVDTKSLWNYFIRKNYSEFVEKSYHFVLTRLFGFDFSNVDYVTMSHYLVSHNLGSMIQPQSQTRLDGRFLLEAFVYATCLPYPDYVRAEIIAGTGD